MNRHSHLKPTDDPRPFCKHIHSNPYAVGRTPERGVPSSQLAYVLAVIAVALFAIWFGGMVGSAFQEKWQVIDVELKRHHVAGTPAQ